MKGLNLGALVCAICLVAAPALAAKAPSITQSLDMVTVGSPKISPDGKRVVYEQTSTNWETNAFDTALWLADAGSGQRRRLTLAVKSSTDAAWSPDGRWIAFLSDRPGALAKSPVDKKQLYVMPADGGEAQQMGVFEKGANSFEWAPDSRSLAVAAEAPEPKAMKDRKETFGDYHVIHADYGLVQLWKSPYRPSTARAASGRSRRRRRSPRARPSVSTAFPGLRTAGPSPSPPSAIRT